MRPAVRNMMTMKQYQRLKVAERQGRSVSDMAKMISRDRKTVRKYLRMDKDEFLRYLERMAERGKAFAEYRDEILLIFAAKDGRPVYSSAIYDYLGERHGELPGSERTLRNYLQYLKASGAIAKGKGREYRPVEDLPYGKQAQIDFGQEPTAVGTAYFVVLVLSRSRYRYVAAQATPFTTLDVIGHLLDAFDYFGGVTEELVLDQDRTMMVAENLGDLTLTKSFTDFVAEQGIKLHACRAADPESKGKVENSVKFVKANFLSSRTFASFDQLQTELGAWLGRANARISQATRRVPLADFEANEKPALRPLRVSLFRNAATGALRESRKVDKQSLVSIGGSKYSVPSSYRLEEVEIERRDGQIRIYDRAKGSLIATHAESSAPGAVVTVAGHYTDRVAATEAIRDDTLARCPDDPRWAAFVLAIWTAHRRYFREHALRLERLFIVAPDRDILGQALAFCLDHGLSHANDLLDAYTARGGLLGVKETTRTPPPTTATTAPVVETRPLDEYQRRLGELCKDNGSAE